MVSRIGRTSNLVAYDLVLHGFILSGRTLAAEGGTRILSPEGTVARLGLRICKGRSYRVRYI